MVKVVGFGGDSKMYNLLQDLGVEGLGVRVQGVEF